MDPPDDQDTYQRWKQGDIIKVVVDCVCVNGWSVTFYKNDKQIGKPMNIVKNISYYAFVCVQSYDIEYRLLS